MIPLSSSNLASCDYSEETRTLTITFHSGDTWSYSDVDKSIYEGLVAASSPGRYFYRQIKGLYPGSQI